MGFNTRKHIGSNGGFNSGVGFGIPGGSAPASLTAPTISGTATVGSTLTAVNGTYSGSPTPTITGIWQRDGVNIAGEISLTYTVALPDVDTDITWFETASNGISPDATQSSNAITILPTIDSMISTFTEILNAWSSDNVNIVTTTTTAIDYKGVHNVSNPAAGNQPSLNVADLDFNGHDTLTFDGISHYLYKAVSDYRIADTSGEIHCVMQNVSSVLSFGFASADESTTTKLITVSGPADERFCQVRGTANNVIIDNAGAKMSDYTTCILLSLVFTGSAYRLFINGTEKTVAMFAGSDDGKYMSTVADRDNIAIGGKITSSPVYSSFKWGATFVNSLMSDGDRATFISQIKTIYDIS